MDILASIGNFIIFQVLDQAPIFLGIITLVGLLLQKTPASEVFEGVIKTIVGMLILNAGADLISNTITPVMQLLNNVVGVNGVMPMNEAAFAVGMSTMSETCLLYTSQGIGAQVDLTDGKVVGAAPVLLHPLELLAGNRRIELFPRRSDNGLSHVCLLFYRRWAPACNSR